MKNYDQSGENYQIRKAKGKQNHQQESFYLPEFFEREFPNLAKLLNENLLKEYQRREETTDKKEKNL